jgi:calcium permeable stress-gated cation channel
MLNIIQQHLEMDPTLYQRDRGELDWDQRSVGATTILGDGSHSLHHGKSGFYASHGATRNSPYDQYRQQGPQRTGTPSGGRLGVGTYEMSRLGGSEANLPLLASHSTASLSAQTGNESYQSLHGRTPSAGPNVAYGSTPMHHEAPTGHYNQGSYHGRAPSAGFDQAVARSGSPYHSRPPSTGLDQAVARSGSPYRRPPSTGLDQAVSNAGSTYPPQYQQQQYSDRQVPSRSGSSMGHYQQSPSQLYAPSTASDSPSRYYTPSPTARGNDGNMAGRGTYRQHY